MRIPDNIKILGHYYEVKQTQSPRRERGTSGTCCVNTQTINIDHLHPESGQAETFMHEIFEALSYHLALADKLDHDTMSALSEGLFCVIRDNKLDFNEFQYQKPVRVA